ncbi:ATP-binding cassette domain-containing protein [uncultured Nocardioides sp.]|uniref:ATP-binding cassette domain-containing protein n=1 Tax=uncultured Nocardioides sp. TaxID=198441 RepID=UPI0026379C7F|nr:ATP-binding cassette domain-containing protein [uncultured Nocardioides sp.]
MTHHPDTPRTDAPPRADLAVETRALTKTYGDRTAVDAVTLTVRRGEIYGFLGPNGAGKTTTLRMVLGLVRPTSGTATVLGRPAGSPAATARAGALIEGPGFHPYLSGRDNLRSLARLRGLPDSDVTGVLERVELADRARDRFRAYSLGMKQRLGVAAALLGDPELVVLDEPTNGLDPAGMADMRSLLVGLAAEGRTVLLSSHMLGEVQEICDRVGVVADGRLLREGAVHELRGRAVLRVTATPTDAALAVAMRLAGDDGVRLAPDAPDVPDTSDASGPAVLEVDLPAARGPALVRALVEADVEVHQVRHVERSLEQVFFEMTTPRTEVAA